MDITARDTLELFWDMGITGNVGAAETLKSMTFVKKKAGVKLK